MAAMLRGVDVSDYQPGIDWAAVMASGVSFAILKATEGTGNVQDTFAGYRTAAPAAGIGPLGIYHFARPEDTVHTPEEEADHFSNIVGRLGPDEFVALDIETGDQATWPEFISRWFARVVERLGPVPNVLYDSDDPSTRLPVSAASHPLWDAAYGPNNGTPPPWGTGYQKQYQGPFEHSWNTGPWSTWTIWQFSSKGTVPGINGYVDVNLAPDDLRARLGLGGAAPAPVPVPTPAQPLMAGLDHQHPTFAQRVSDLCRATGCTVYSGARSTDEQAALYQKYLAGTGNPANSPGHSWHEYGDDLVGGPYAIAVDLAGDLNVAHARAGELGLHFPVSSEAWHVQPIEVSETARVPGAEDRLPATPGPTPSLEEALTMQRQIVNKGADYLWLGPERIFARITTGGVFDVLKAGNDVPRVEVDDDTLQSFKNWALNAGFTG